MLSCIPLQSDGLTVVLALIVAAVHRKATNAATNSLARLVTPVSMALSSSLSPLCAGIADGALPVSGRPAEWLAGWLLEDLLLQL